MVEIYYFCFAKIIFHETTCKIIDSFSDCNAVA